MFLQKGTVEQKLQKKANFSCIAHLAHPLTSCQTSTSPPLLPIHAFPELDSRASDHFPIPFTLFAYLLLGKLQFSSVQSSRSAMSDSLQPHGPQQTRPPCPSPTLGVSSNWWPLSWWCHSTILSSVIPFFSCLQSFPASRSFPMSQLFASGGQSIGASASASVIPMNTQEWPPLGWTGCVSLQSKGLSRVFTNTTVQKHQFFSTQLSLKSNSNIDTWLLEKP